MKDDVLSFLSARFGVTAKPVAFPGGLRRKTALYQVGDRTVVVSRRSSVARAALEARVLRALEPEGIAPRLLVQDGVWIVQERVEGNRLPVVLDARPDEAQDLMARAWTALVTAQDRLKAAGLADHAPALGTRPEWQSRLADAPRHLASLLDMPVPDYSFGDALSVAPGLVGPIKWDARPGNALMRPDGKVCWFDWEHAGVRNRTDDAAWFFTDEWSPDAPDVRATAIDDLAQRSGVAASETGRRVNALSVAHACVRLLMVYDLKGDGPWWPRARCLAEDRVGVTAEAASRLASRAALGAGSVAGLEPLVPFFETLANGPDVAISKA